MSRQAYPLVGPAIQRTMTPRETTAHRNLVVLSSMSLMREDKRWSKSSDVHLMTSKTIRANTNT